MIYLPQALHFEIEALFHIWMQGRSNLNPCHELQISNG